MRKEFMKAAKRVGTFLTAGLLALGLSFNAQAQNELPLPAFPANFEVAEYQSQKSCVPNDAKFITAVSINSGANLIGTQDSMQSPRDGAYHESFFFNEVSGVGYVMSNKQDGKLCLVDKLNDVSIGKAGSYQQVVYEGEISKIQCDQIPYRFEGICGNFNSLSSKLTSKGFNLLWQASDVEGNIKTWLTGNGKTYVLTTDSSSNATVLTGVSQSGEYQLHEDAAPQLVAKY